MNMAEFCPYPFARSSFPKIQGLAGSLFHADSTRSGWSAGTRTPPLENALAALCQVQACTHKHQLLAHPHLQISHYTTYLPKRERDQERRKTFCASALKCRVPTAWRKRVTGCSPSPPAARPMRSAHHQCRRTLHEEFKRRIKTQTVLPSLETALCCLGAVASEDHRAQVDVADACPKPTTRSLTRADR